MYDSTFTPSGPTVLVGVSVVQVNAATQNAVEPTSYRVRCLATGYLAWYPSQTVGAPTFTAAAPTAGNPASNTIGMNAGGVETFSFPQGGYFLSSVAAGFEVTPGEGV